jgi:hypothetical protein
MTPSDRYALLIARLTTRRALLSTLAPRPDYKQRAELSNLNTRLETLQDNAAKLEAFTDAARVCREELLKHGSDVTLETDLNTALKMIIYYEALAPDLSELTELAQGE